MIHKDQNTPVCASDNIITQQPCQCQQIRAHLSKLVIVTVTNGKWKKKRKIHFYFPHFHPIVADDRQRTRVEWTGWVMRFQTCCRAKKKKNKNILNIHITVLWNLANKKRKRFGFCSSKSLVKPQPANDLTCWHLQLNILQRWVAWKKFQEPSHSRLFWTFMTVCAAEIICTLQPHFCT